MEVYSGRLSLPTGHFTNNQQSHSKGTLFAKKKLQNINCIEQPTSFYGGLFLGDIITLLKPEILQEHKIQAIISCISDECHPSLDKKIVRKIILAKDNLDYPISKHFEQSYEFIQYMRENNKNVLVHCHAGISRSATLVCAYLMRKKGWRMEESLNQMRKQRERIKPNNNFLSQLQGYEQKLFDQPKQRNQAKKQKNIFNRIRTAIKGEEENFETPKKVLPSSSNTRIPLYSSVCSAKQQLRKYISPQVAPNLKISFQSPNGNKMNQDLRSSLAERQINSIKMVERKFEGVFQINWNKTNKI